ncbi:Uncharacterized protein BM_BM1264 [Brugia malayi]|uniref:Bm1264 n=1 Tax=Brugia malayi TaxID=6279 RepID=A0A0J9XSR0_BRUMA|nr:Uncharacterized protein BM_BM1264 [Brugia malayi]CDP94616.1 Bm1264 [Brugia malayi]VIO86801.1 Uncharacterized protein BM_BM1264 [Brugia malayi]
MDNADRAAFSCINIHKKALPKQTVVGVIEGGLHVHFVPKADYNIQQ